MSSRHVGKTRHRPLAPIIKQAREDAGLSQPQLAAKLGVAQSMVGRWETISEPRLSVLADIERVLGLPRAELLRRAGYIPSNGAASVRLAIEQDPKLDKRAKEILLAAYRSQRR